MMQNVYVFFDNVSIYKGSGSKSFYHFIDSKST